jgi:hypothetical protein
MQLALSLELLKTTDIYTQITDVNKYKIINKNNIRQIYCKYPIFVNCFKSIHMKKQHNQFQLHSEKLSYKKKLAYISRIIVDCRKFKLA